LALAEHEHVGRHGSPCPHAVAIAQRLDREQIIRAGYELARELLVAANRDEAAGNLLVVDLRMQLPGRRDHQYLATRPDRQRRIRWSRARRSTAAAVSTRLSLSERPPPGHDTNSCSIHRRQFSRTWNPDEGSHPSETTLVS